MENSKGHRFCFKARHEAHKEGCVGILPGHIYNWIEAHFDELLAQAEAAQDV